MLRILTVVLGLLAGPSLLSAQEETCASCHDQTKKIAGSVHEPLGCATCHEKHEDYPHPKTPKPKCADCHDTIVRQHASSVHGQELKKGNGAAPECSVCHNDVHETKTAKSPEFRKAVPETCGMCHGTVAEQFNVSVHGKAVANGINEAPLCTDCHGEHSIQRTNSEQSPVHPSHIRETCASCHADVRLNRKFDMPGDRVASFEESFHGLASKAGSSTAANCASCHGIHNILPSSDSKSTVHAKNLAKTCGQCHPGMSDRYAIGPVHFVEGRSEPEPVRWVRQFYWLVIPLTLGFMLVHNIGDWFRKLYNLRFAAQTRFPQHHQELHPKPEIRMYRFEQIEHVLLLTSFTVLVWTGFALKYPDAWWARPLLLWEDRFPVRGTIHRVAGVVMMGVGLMHAISLLTSRRLRGHWLNLIPRWTDVPQSLHSFAYNLGLTSKPPRLPAYNFIEKAEYWAVVWGTVIMGITGIMLWANNYFLSLVPKVFLDVATAVHFYEAILAALAILIWHIYFVVFDPEVYPMQTAWLTGKSVRRHHDAGEPSAQRSVHDDEESRSGG
jgi:cytochrome b subunit of formate dehydrogenase